MKYDVCVLGGCALDINRYPDGSFELVPGGKGSNQAVAASRAGAKVAIISKVGSDSYGEEILRNLSRNGVNISSVIASNEIQNDMADIIISETGENDIRRRNADNSAINSFTVDLVNQFSDVILNSKIVVMQFKAPKEVSEALIEFCHKNNKPIVLTPCRPEKIDIAKQADVDLLNKVSIITCNESECKKIFKTEDIISCVKSLPNKLIVTLGSKGVMYFNGTDVIFKPAVEIEPSKVIDTTGAGDTFNGNLVAALCDGYELDEAIERAQYASSMKIQKRTAQKGMPTKEQLNEYIKNLVQGNAKKI